MGFGALFDKLQLAFEKQKQKSEARRRRRPGRMPEVIRIVFSRRRLPGQTPEVIRGLGPRRFPDLARRVFLLPSPCALRRVTARRGTSRIANSLEIKDQS